MSAPATSYEEVTRWLVANHQMSVTSTYANSGGWQCSCGAENGPGTRLTFAQARANADRHLKAQRRAYLAAQR